MIQRAAQHITNGDELDNPRDRHEVIGRLHAIWTDMLAAAPVQPASKPEVVAYMQPNGNTISVQRLNEGLNRQQFVQDIWKDAIPLTRCNTSSKPEASEAAQEPGRIDTPKFREVLYAYSAGRVSTQHFIWYIEEHCARQISAAQPAPARDAQTDFEAYWNSLADDPSASAEIVMSCKYAAAEAWKAALQSQPAPEAGKSESAPAQAVTDEQILEMARQCSISEHGQIFEFARRLLGSAKTQGDAA
jgi:hypothetical protein